MHHSIVITGVQYLIPKCTTCCTLYHCPLCPSLKPMTQKKVQFHWEVHLKNAIVFQDKRICKCHLYCRSDSHFHCPCCSKTVLRRHAMEAHLQLCLTAQKKPPRLSSPVFAKPSVTPASKSSLSTPTLAPCTSTREIASGSAPCISMASGSAPCNSIPSGSAPCMSTAPVSALCTSKPEIASVSAPCISIGSVSALCTSEPEISSVSAPCTSSPELCDSTPLQFPLASFADRKRTTCPHCSAVMLKKNLNIHIQRKHTDHTQDVPMQSHLYGVCIDMFNGVYAVQKSGNGFSVPVHVQRKTWGKEYQLKCDLQECWENQQLAPSCEHTFSLCEHLSSLDYCCETVFEELLDPSVLDEMVKLKFFGETKKAVCLRRQKVAQTAHVPFSVLVTFGDSQKRFTLSIYEPVVNQFSRLGRVMVTYNSTAGTWDCPCAKPRMSCPHKNIAKWHLFQTNIQLFTSEIPSDEASVKKLSEDLNCAIQFDLHRTVEYIYSMKKIPSALQDGAHPKSASDFPSSLCPVESCCMMCDDDTTLELPMLTTRNAQIVTMTGVINDVSTYTRRCPGCQMIYRYQEWCDGLHNFNDNIILTLELCLYLRHSLQSHVCVSRAIDTLESLRGEKYPDRETVQQAYCHFEALAEIDYTYSCVNCGDHPPVVILDLHKNGVFSIAARDLKEPTSDFKGEVNIEDFWQSVDQEMIACGFVSSRAQNPFVVEPSYESWAPWIGEKTRKGSTVLNTEYEKVTSPEHQAFSVSEDRLVEELMKQEVDVVRKLCKACNVDSNGSRMDMILQLRAEMQNKQSYEKIFQKTCGSSGGWSVVMCPHGVVYSLKFHLRTESPRDFVDLLFSWQHLPNVTICDSPGDLATHANERTPLFPPFHPHEGRLADATLENINKAKQEKLKVSLPWLLEKTDNLTSNAHPVTGSSEHYVLSDKLYETNTKDPKDVLRNTILVPELQDWLNRQAAEQLVAELRKNDYFTNHMASSTHVFMMRNIIHYKNVAANQELLRDPL